MLKGKKVSVLGLGVSGIQSALFLSEKGYSVYASDKSRSDELVLAQKVLSERGVRVEIGGHDEDRILDSDWVLVSPGISPFSPLMKKLESLKIPTASEIEVASWYCSSPHQIAVTGAAGKTTMVSLITALCQLNGRRAVSCGNIGNPWVGELKEIHESDIVILELSSFQLHYSLSLKPRIGVLMNISPNHLDWHLTMDHYVRSKLNLFHNQTPDDFALIRSQDRKEYFPDCPLNAKVVLFDLMSESSTEAILNCVADIHRFPRDTVQMVLNSFQGIEHRLEKVGVFRQVSYVNDSKCTTPLSLSWALQKYPDQSVILLAGGRAKSKDFHTLKDLLKQKVKKAYLFGESADYIEGAWSGGISISRCRTLEQAIESAADSALPGDIVLLSPACASFDMFKNYQERGKIFKQRVNSLFSACQTS